MDFAEESLRQAEATIKRLPDASQRYELLVTIAQQLIIIYATQHRYDDEIETQRTLEDLHRRFRLSEVVK